MRWTKGNAHPVEGKNTATTGMIRRKWATPTIKTFGANVTQGKALDGNHEYNPYPTQDHGTAGPTPS